jgi:hypothetical protein
MILLKAEDVLGGLDAKTLAEALLAKISAPKRPDFDDGPAIPMIGQPWASEGGINGGLVRGRDGCPDYYLIVAAEDRGDIKWKDAMAWAKEIEANGHRDFTLPYRNEQAVLFGNVPELFEKAWYWSCEQHAEDDCYAWCQSVDNGNQDDTLKTNALRARAVRRLVI